MIARLLFIVLLAESLAGCSSGQARASVGNEDVVVAAVLRDIIAHDLRGGTPLICAPSSTDPTTTILGLVRSNTTLEVGVCSDLTSDPSNKYLAVSRPTGLRAFVVFWNEVKRQSRQYMVKAGFSCGATCGNLYQYRVGRTDGLWQVLSKVVLLHF